MAIMNPFAKKTPEEEDPKKNPAAADEEKPADGAAATPEGETPAVSDDDIDARIAKALESQMEQITASINSQLKDAVSEVQRFSSMSPEEQSNYTQQQKTDDLARREADITRRELSASAKDTLASRGLPAGLAEVLNYTDADSMNASIAAVEKAFNEAVQAAVAERLRGGKTPTKAKPESEETRLDDRIAKAMRGGLSGIV